MIELIAAAGPVVVERWFPKAGIDGRSIDLRVMVIDGRARHCVVRTSRSPVTNLHLGNQRGDLSVVQTRLGPAGWGQVVDLAERAAGCFPDTMTVGVDLMINTGWDRFAVAEVNAFGDLLPGVLVDGRDAYAWQAAAYADQLAGSRSA